MYEIIVNVILWSWYFPNHSGGEDWSHKIHYIITKSLKTYMFFMSVLWVSKCWNSAGCAVWASDRRQIVSLSNSLKSGKLEGDRIALAKHKVSENYIKIKNKDLQPNKLLFWLANCTLCEKTLTTVFCVWKKHTKTKYRLGLLLQISTQTKKCFTLDTFS